MSLLIFYLHISLSIAERCEDNTIYKYYCLNIAERCEGNTIYNIRFGHNYFLYFIVWAVFFFIIIILKSFKNRWFT